MPKEFIVAIELGSSKMTGIAGQKNLDGSITVLAIVEENSSSCIRKGVIYNIDKTCQCLTSIIKKLKNILKQDIAQVYVGVGGRSIRSIKNVIVKDLPGNSIISQEMINEIMDVNRNMTYPDQEILDAATQEYKIDNQFQTDPVGIQCNHLEGIFLNILWRKNFYNNINTCFENANIPIAEMYLAPLAMADSVLNDSEKRAGCMLVDLGADTTTVSVYYKGILRHLSVIPLGSSNITKDLTCLQIEETDAENMKLKYAKAYTDISNIDPTLNYQIDRDRYVESKKFIEIVEARVEEIVENAWFQVPVEYSDKLMGGIILTGTTGGDKIEIKCPTSDEASMKARGELEVRRRSFDGYEGSITGWLVPMCKPGDSAVLRDRDYEYKDGTYFVAAVTTEFGRDGGKRKVTLGFKLS